MILQLDVPKHGAWHLALMLWTVYEGEDWIERSIIEIGESLGVDAIEGESYVATIVNRANEEV